MAKPYKPYQPEQDLLLPPSLKDWLPEKHLVYFISEVVDELDLTKIYAVYEKDTRGQPPYDPRMMTKVLVYGYRVGVYSARKIQQRLKEDVAFRGCSTRDVARITEKHLGQKYDSKQISRIVGRASQDLEAWRTRRLEGRKYKFLYIDGANCAVRINRRVNRQSFCAVLGVSEEGQCFEVLALEMGDREHMDLWENVFRSLLERGLNKEGVELGIMDGLPGLEGVFKRFFPRSQTQRCQKHAKANACRQVRKAEREEFSKDLNKVFYAANEAAARTAFFAVKDRWGKLFPSAVGRIEKDLDSLLTFFQFDATYWTVLRTTNLIERLNKEFKRRTRAMEVTGGEISTYRCLAYVAQTMEYRWSFHPLSQWASVYTQIAA